MQDLEAGIDELYAGSLDAFVREREALAKARADGGDAAGAARVRALRKPVVSAWALNRLAREQPEAVNELVALGNRLRAAQRRAISGADVEPLREAIEERRRAITSLARAASELLERAGIGAAPHSSDLVSTLEAAAADEEAAELLRSGRVVKPLRPPGGFEEHGLRVVQGGRAEEPRAEASSAREKGDGREIDRERAQRSRELERALAQAQRRERSAAAQVDRARRRLQDLEGKRAEARDALKVSEAEHRGAEIEASRLASAVAKLRRHA
jgi:hypothetical protein